MLRFLAACTALVAVTLPASSQTMPPGSTAQVTVPSAQNSGAGIPGQPGTESGPAAKPGVPGTTARDQQNEAAREQDSAKIPGLPGNKSGPTVRPPSGPSAANQSSAQNGSQSIQQKVRQNLEQAGFTDIQLMPSSFLVRAKDRDGNPVMMVINPDSVTALTVEGTKPGTTTGQGNSNQPSSPGNKGALPNMQR